jgi:fungal STAND N-terminal Goodbye domain
VYAQLRPLFLSLTLSQPSSPLFMSSTATSSNFQSIFDAALADYAKQTGIDLATHPFAQTLQACDSADAVLVLLREKASQFQAYRDGNRKLINALKPVVGMLHTVASILGEAATLVSPANQPVLSDPVFITLFPGSIPTYQGSPRWPRCPPHRAYSPHF